MLGENYVGGYPLPRVSLWDNSVAIWPHLGPPE